MEDLRPQIKSQENIIEKISRWIPGFSGYKDREQRRNADQITRRFLADSLAAQRGRIQAAGLTRVQAGDLSLAPEFDRATGRLDKVSDRLRHAEYGYSGFFDVVKVGEPELDQLYEHDLSLVSVVQAVEEAVTAVEKGENPWERLATLQSKLAEFEGLLAEREKILKGVG